MWAPGRTEVTSTFLSLPQSVYKSLKRMLSVWPEALGMTKLSNPVHAYQEAESKSGYSGRETIEAL